MYTLWELKKKINPLDKGHHPNNQFQQRQGTGTSSVTMRAIDSVQYVQT